MADYGIKISKEGYSALDVPTESTKKNFIILDSTEAEKILYKGFVTSGTYTHNLGYVPGFFVFKVDSTTNPTYFESSREGKGSTTQITNIPNPSYIIVLY